MRRRGFSPDPDAARTERQEIVGELERGLQRAQRSAGYRSYLKTLARFHRFSISNTVLIWLQRPSATRVASYRAWLALGRQVRWGEKGIRILAPTYRRVPPAIHNETGEFEEREIRRLRFRIVSVFDVSQTDRVTAMPPPPVARLPSLDARQLWQRLAIIARTEGLTIDRTGGRGGAEGVNGWHDRGGREIWIDPDLAPVMATKTLCHEIAHHYAAHSDCSPEDETIAESVACTVLGHFGIEAPHYSFRYLAHWPDVATFRAKLLDIQAIAIRLIERMAAEQQSGG